MKQFRITFKNGLPTNWLNMSDFTINQVNDLVKAVTKHETDYNIEYR